MLILSLNYYFAREPRQYLLQALHVSSHSDRSERKNKILRNET